MTRTLPSRPHLDFLKKEAKELLAAHQAAQPEATDRLRKYFPTLADIGLAEAQLTLAREYGFASWAKLKQFVETSPDAPTPLAFVNALLEPPLPEALKMWEAHHATLRQDVAVAAMVGDLESVRRAVAEQPSLLKGPISPKDIPLLCYPCFSRLALVAPFTPGILATVKFLLDAGADPNEAFLGEWNGESFRETPLYGAAGVLNHPELAKLLLEAGADPDDHSVDEHGVYRGESLYHASEHANNASLRLLLEAKPSQEARDYCIRRKLDFEDLEGIELFLKSGANPNRVHGTSALSHAILRGRSVAVVELLHRYGADLNLPDADGTTPYALARRLGRSDIAEWLVAHGADTTLSLTDALVAAAADGNEIEVRRLSAQHPEIRDLFSSPANSDLHAIAGAAVDFAQAGHVAALRALLDLGLPIGAANPSGQTILHYASIAARPEAIRLLLEHGAPTDVRDNLYQSTPMGWLLWGSQWWNGDHGDYVEGLKVYLDFGHPRPDPDQGSEAIQAYVKSLS